MRLKIPERPQAEIIPSLRDMLMVTHSRGAMLQALDGEIPVAAPTQTELVVTGRPLLFGAPAATAVAMAGLGNLRGAAR